MDIKEYLLEKIDTGEVIEIIYNGGSKPGTLREICPVNFVEDKLSAIDIETEVRKTYILSKIRIPNQNLTYSTESPARKEKSKKRPLRKESKSEKQVEQLKFFKVKNIKELDYYQANDLLKELLRGKKNKEKWNNRPPEAEQKQILDFFEIEHKELTFPEVKKIINDLFEDEEKYDKWYDYITAIEDAKDERESWFEDYREFYNEENRYFNCKKLNKKIFKEIIEELEAEGNTLEQLEDCNFYQIVFERALNKYPNLTLKPKQISAKNYSKPNTPDKNNKTLKIFLVVAVISIIFYSINHKEKKKAPPIEKKSWHEIVDKKAAFYAAQQFIEKYLKVPKTAEHPSYYDIGENNIKHLGSQTYEINSYVDSQNSFGALLRTDYYLKIMQHKKDKWKLLDIKTLEGK